MANRYVVFRLYGPMVAWGDIAVGERRQIGSSPSRSGVLGLVGAALGVRRDDEEGQRALHAQYGFASRVDQAGSLLTDFHTAQSPAEKLIKDRPPARRADELNFPRADRGMQTILSWRDYRTDAMALGCVWAQHEAPRWTTDQLVAALRRPVFTLYLGRKSCPLALPLHPVVVEAAHPALALQQKRPDQEETFLRCIGWTRQAGGRSQGGTPATIFWEGTAEEEPVRAERREVRRDRVRDRSRWQFQNREQRAMSWRDGSATAVGAEEGEEPS